jgi:D-glycero-D-manno-heptose 1,7-bisphosphate phosphatase
MKIVFLDKDGTLIKNIHYSADPSRVEFLKGSINGLKRLQLAGYKFIIITNQPAIDMELFSATTFKAYMHFLREALAAYGIELLDWFACPHGTNSRCDCRKPEPGMILHALKIYEADPAECWMIGDILTDVEAGRRAGLRTILITNGNETEWDFERYRVPDFCGDDLDKAAAIILKEDFQMERTKVVPNSFQQSG